MKPWLSACALLLAACSPGEAAAAPRHVVVFAASSLTAAFEALATGFEQRHPGVAVELHFAGTPQLVLQLREGAPADVFAAADTVNMQRVVAAGRTAAVPTAFARNGLAIVVATGNPQGVAALADLARSDLRVALCGPEVPAGRYARQALAQAGVTVRSLSDEPNVKALIGKVRLGELDAGIVYRTDTRDPGVAGIDVAPAHDVLVEYPIVALKDGPAADLASAFVDYVCSADGARVLDGFGFRRP